MKFWACVLAMMVPGIVMADIASTTYTDKALSSKADDSTVVHKTGDETIGGTKTFSNMIVSTAPWVIAAQSMDLGSNNDGASMRMRGSKSNQLLMNTDNNGVVLSVDDQYDKEATLAMLEQGNTTIELTTNNGREAAALIMQDDTGNRIQMGKPYTGSAGLYMMGEYTEIGLEAESSDVYATASGDSAMISIGSSNGGVRLMTAPNFNNGKPTLGFNNAGKTAYISFDSNYINLDQHLKAPFATIGGVLTIGNRIELAREVPSDFDNNTVPDTKWVNDRIEDARGVIPVGGADGTETAQIWIE